MFPRDKLILTREYTLRWLYSLRSLPQRDRELRRFGIVGFMFS
jgi:hypothetical protein